MKHEEGGLGVKKSKLVSLPTKNLHIKVLALIFAMMIWGFVLADQNPSRIKTVYNVDVSFDGESDLLARNLVVRGNRAEILKPVQVNVNTDIVSYADLTKDNVTATISLRNVSMKGKINLPIIAYTSIGSIDSVVPKSVNVEIDNLVRKTVPVEISYQGALPEGYWSGTPDISKTEIEIRGAEQDVNRITKAICSIQLDGRTESYNDAVILKLVDDGGNEIDAGLLLGGAPSVTVRMTVLPCKSVPIVMSGALLGVDNLAPNFELQPNSTKITPSTIEIAAEQEILDEIDYLELEGIDISGASSSIYQLMTIKVPKNVTLLGSSVVEAFIDIREKTSQIAFSDIPIKVVGLGKGQKAELSVEVASLQLTGRISLIKAIDRSEVEIYVDVTGLRPGTHFIPLDFKLADEKAYNELEYKTAPEGVTVNIK